jgi:SAM-dependent methyltransferase
VDEHLRAVSRVYSPETWDVYELLDRSLDPRGPEMMLAAAAELLTPASVVLDVGCRDASHLIELVRASGGRGAGLDPLPQFVARSREAVAAAALENRIQIAEASMQAIPWPDASFDVVWCRDVIEIVEPLDAALAEVVRVLRPDGRLLLYTVFATDALEPKERELLAANLTLVPENLHEARVEAALTCAGLEVVTKDVIGTEWREHAEERTAPASRDLLRLARLRRRRDEVVELAGEEIYSHVESNLHWLAFQLLGKLRPTLYVLRRAR